MVTIKQHLAPKCTVFELWAWDRQTDGQQHTCARSWTHPSTYDH